MDTEWQVKQYHSAMMNFLNHSVDFNGSSAVPHTTKPSTTFTWRELQSTICKNIFTIRS